MRGKLPRRKKSKKQRRRYSDSSSERHSTDHNSDSNTYPDVEPLNSKTAKTDGPKLAQKKLDLRKISLSESPQHQVQSTSYSDEHRWSSIAARPFTPQSSSPNTHREGITYTPKREAAPSSSTSSFETGILKEILKTTIQLNLKVDDLSGMFMDLMKTTAKPTFSTNSIAKPPEIMNLFPVDEASLKELESWLAEDSNKDILVQELLRIGGSDLTEVVRKLMYKIFTNEVGMLYSWEGAKKKRAFKTLAIASVIKDVVRNSEQTKRCSETETVNIIKAWLVRSTDRYNNETKAARKKNIDDEL